MRDRCLQGVEAVVERQQRVPAKGNDDGFVLNRENGRSRLSRPGWQIGDRASPLPLGDGFLIDAVSAGLRLSLL
jgi:hypothetical protein